MEKRQGQSGMFRSADEIVASLAFALQKKIGLGDCVGFSVDLLTVQVRGYLLLFLLCDFVRVSSPTVNIPPVPQAPS